jgi:hypothetical protein
MFYYQVKMDFTNLVHFVTLKSPLKYISCYETTWKLPFMVNQHVIEFWEKYKCCSLRIFLFSESICIILQNSFTSNFIDEKVPQRLYLIISKLYISFNNYTYSMYWNWVFFKNMCAQIYYLGIWIRRVAKKKLPSYMILWTF